MPEEFFFALTILAFVGPLALWGIWDSWLKHRAKLAKIYSGDKVARLTSENTELNDKVEMLEDRMAVLEQIAVDPARRTADEIEKLR
jgi:hypothetical protein